MDNHNPVSILWEINRIKFKKAAIPLILIIASFLLQMKLGIENIKFISLLGLALYLYVVLGYRVKKNIPNCSSQEVLAPINGKIVSISSDGDYHTIIIRKRTKDTAEIRNASYNESLEKESDKLSFHNEQDVHWIIETGKPIILSKEEEFLQGRMIGFVPYSATCKVRLNKKFNIAVDKENVISGVTVLATLNDIQDYNEPELTDNIKEL